MRDLNNKILDLMYHSIISEGGDGDALWLAEHTTLENISMLIKEYNINNNSGWGLEVKDNYLLWGIEQEWAMITNDKEFFEKQPSHIILKINY